MRGQLKAILRTEATGKQKTRGREKRGQINAIPRTEATGKETTGK